jgi:hypothetical protein
MAIEDLHGGSAHHTEWSTDTGYHGELSSGKKILLVTLILVTILFSVVTFSKLISLERQEMEQKKAR